MAARLNVDYKRLVRFLANLLPLQTLPARCLPFCRPYCAIATHNRADGRAMYKGTSLIRNSADLEP